MSLYFFFHAKTSRLKREHGWGSNLKQVRMTDLAARTADEMLPWYVYLMPIVITIGLIVYTERNMQIYPNSFQHIGELTVQPDAFSTKTPFSVITLLLILLIMQGMMLGINELTKRSGIKINASQKKKSRAQQLSFRKYTSWLLFMTTYLSRFSSAFFSS